MTLATPQPNHFPDAGNMVFVPFSPEELRALEYRERLPGAAWGEENVTLKKGPRPGPWRNDNNPPLIGIMNILSLWHVRVGVVQKGIQTGGTQAFYILLGMEADYSNGHDNALVVMADEKSVQKHSRNRLRRLFQDSPSLSAIMSPNPDDTGIYSIRLLSDFRVDIGWASSEVSLASETYRIVILDEISKYKDTGNIKEAKGRTTNHEDDKRIWIVSSPDMDGDDPIQTEMEEVDIIMHFEPVCPACGTAQVMQWEQFRWPKQQTLEGKTEADHKEILRRKLARYECIACRDHWDDAKRDEAVLTASKLEPWNGWVPNEAIDRFRSVGFLYPSWLSPFVGLSTIVAERLAADEALEKTGDDEPLKKWTNTRAGLQYQRKAVGARKEDQILALRDPSMPRGVVPRDASRLMLLVDTQQHGFYFEVAAFGWGKDLETWQIDNGFVESFDDIKTLADKRWNDADGKEYAVTWAFIDSGGGTNPYRPKHSRTKEVYEFCVENPIFRPLKGRRDLATPWKVTRLDYYPSRDGKNVPIPGGLNLYNINVTIFKDQLAGKLQLSPDRAGAFHLHAEASDDYARQMCAEVRDERGYWECPKGRANHYWDIAVYRFAAAEITRIKDKQKPEENTPERPAARPAPAPAPASARSAPAQFPSWFRNRR